MASPGSYIVRPFRTQHVIGRAAELQKIEAALNDTSGATHILVLRGPGGIGKTFLLEKTLDAARQTRPQGCPEVVASGIIDLFFSETHSSAALEQTIVADIDPAGEFFAEYTQQRQEYETLRRKSVPADRLEGLRADVTAAFIRCFNRLSATRRVLLAFDTAESIQYEPEALRRICRAEQGTQSAAIKDWLLQVLPQLHNTVILIAGREHHRHAQTPLPFWDDVRDSLNRAAVRGELILAESRLDRFTEAEALAYFEEVIRTAQQQPGLDDLADNLLALSEAERRQIYRYTEGRPIRLSLFIDLIRWDWTDLYDLLQSQAGDQTWELVEDRVVAGILAINPGHPVNQILRLLVATQPGLDADLLHTLTDWSRDDCAARLHELGSLSFIKQRQGPDGDLTVFLHDEMYDLLFERLGHPQTTYVENWAKAAAYYRDRLAQDSEKRLDVEVKLLHYLLRSDPLAGYDAYLQATENAIYEHRVSHDMQLRDEMIRFFAVEAFHTHARRLGLSDDQVARDSTIHWIKRHIEQDRPETACQVAETVLAFAPDDVRALVDGLPATSDRDTQDEVALLYRQGDVLFWGALLQNYALTLTYLARAPEARLRAILTAALKLMKNAAASPTRPAWLIAFVTGEMHNQLGYLHRTAGRYGAALDEYALAEHLFRQIERQGHLAQALNNMAFVQAMVGRPDLAQITIREAYNLRKDNVGGHPLALTQNTWGLIASLAGDPEWGVELCRAARSTFEELREQRGLGLTLIALGFTYRRLGERWKEGRYAQKQAEAYFQEAIRCLERAVHIFSEEAREPIRLWEAYDELGSTYIDLAWLYRNFSRPDFEQASRCLETAVVFLNKALDSLPPGSMTLQRADTYDDLAQALADHGSLKKLQEQFDAAQTLMAQADDYLQRAHDLVDDAYRLVAGQGFRPIREPDHAYWALLGKLHRQRAIWSFARVREAAPNSDEQYRLLDEVAQNFALSAAYFQHYWPGSAYLAVVLRAVSRRTRQLEPHLRRRLRLGVERTAAEYQVDLKALLDVIGDVGQGTGPLVEP